MSSSSESLSSSSHSTGDVDVTIAIVNDDDDSAQEMVEDTEIGPDGRPQVRWRFLIFDVILYEGKVGDVSTQEPNDT